jgi:hypothetical protein
MLKLVKNYDATGLDLKFINSIHIINESLVYMALEGEGKNYNNILMFDFTNNLVRRQIGFSS